MSKIDESYHELLNDILQDGYLYDDPNRKGIQRLEIPSYTFKHKFSDGFPAITTKKLHYKNVVTELIWFLNGNTNIKYLVDNGCNIWNKDAYNYYLKNAPLKKHRLPFNVFMMDIKSDPKTDVLPEWKNYGYVLGDLGPVYGRQWRNFSNEDQIINLINGLISKPLGTEHIVNSWNAGHLKSMALPPCHYGFQVVVKPLTPIEQTTIGYQHEFVYGFELHWTQRSVDTFLGLPYNIASYATLALILEKITGYKALGIQGDLKKVHLYDNSLDAVKEQLSRDVNKYDKSNLLPFNSVIWNKYDDTNELLHNLFIDEFKLESYESYPAINVEMLERNT
jgi:thymidylate synthase